MSIDNTGSENARLAKIHYEQTVKSVLRSFPWTCCTKRDTLTQTDAPAFGWSYAYQLPNDFLRAVSVNDANALGDRDKWKIERNTLVSDDDSVQLVYVYHEEDAEQYDDLLSEAISVLLAAKLAAPITGNPAAGEVFMREYQNITLGMATKVDAQESESNQNHPLETILKGSVLGRRRQYSPLG